MKKDKIVGKVVSPKEAEKASVVMTPSPVVKSPGRGGLPRPGRLPRESRSPQEGRNPRPRLASASEKKGRRSRRSRLTRRLRSSGVGLRRVPEAGLPEALRPPGRALPRLSPSPASGRPRLPRLPRLRSRVTRPRAGKASGVGEWSAWEKTFGSGWVTSSSVKSVWSIEVDKRYPAWVWSQGVGVTASDFNPGGGKVSLRVTVSSNNTHLTASWWDGGVERHRVKTAGSVGYTGTKRGARESGQSALRSRVDERYTVFKSRGRRVPPVDLYLDGGEGGLLSVAGPMLLQMGLKVASVTDVMAEVMGGCRPKKERRV